MKVDPATTRDCDGYPGLVRRPSCPQCGSARYSLKVQDHIGMMPLEPKNWVKFMECEACGHEQRRQACPCGDPGDCGECS